MSIHTTYDTKGISKLLTVHAINSAFDMSAPSFKTNILMGSTWYSPNKITILTKLGPRYSLKQDKVKDYDILGWNWCKYKVAILNFQTVSIQNITRVAKKKNICRSREKFNKKENPCESTRDIQLLKLKELYYTPPLKITYFIWTRSLLSWWRYKG